MISFLFTYKSGKKIKSEVVEALDITDAYFIFRNNNKSKIVDYKQLPIPLKKIKKYEMDNIDNYTI